MNNETELSTDISQSNSLMDFIDSTNHSIKTIKKIFNTDTKGNDKNMKTEKIIDMWYEKSKIEITEKYTDLSEKLINDDKNVALINKSIDDLNTKLKENDCSKTIPYPVLKVTYLTPEFKMQLCEINDKESKVFKSLLEKYKEIKTMVSACETYEQEIEILKSYGVIDKDGKLNIK